MLGIVIPTYKEADSIRSLIEEILKNVPDAQIMVVDDSPDLETAAAVENIKLPAVRVLHRTSKGGRGSAVLAGIENLLSRGCQQIAEMDADFSHPPSQLPALVKEARERKLDLLIASRYLPNSRITNWPVTRRIFSKLSNILARNVLRVPIADYTNGYRIYSRTGAETVVRTCGRLGKGFIALSEILVNLYFRGYSVGETPTVFTNRVRGESSLSRAEIQNALIGLFRIYGLKKELQHKPEFAKGIGKQ